MLSLFEGLTSLHPASGSAMAGLATHYQVSPDGRQYRFYLRGHPNPRGIRLADSSDLRGDSLHSRQSASVPAPAARWSDDVLLTAQDFVYSWRRVLDPATAAPDARLMYCLAGARDVNAGRLAAERLGVRALDDFTLEAELEAPTPYFPELVSNIVYCPVPRHVIQAAGVRWTDPDRMVSNGAFVLRERRPYDRIVLARNERYYEAREVALRELVFMIVTDGNARLNLYRSGGAAVMFASIPAVIPALRRKKDFQAKPSYASAFFVINTGTPPLDDVRVRYALNMATDKRPLADLTQAGSIPAVGLVPATGGYQALKSLPISIDGVEYDVLSFNPRAARQLLLKTGKTLPAHMECVGGNFADTKLIQQVLQRQWREHLGVDLEVIAEEVQTWIQSVHSGSYRHIADSGSPQGSYVDPAWFLDLFRGSGGYGTGWSDPQYDAMLTAAEATVDPALRLAGLTRCERRLLEAMPIIPYCHEVQSVLTKPFVKGLGNNRIIRMQFKYAWIDTNWRPQ